MEYYWTLLNSSSSSTGTGTGSSASAGAGAGAGAGVRAHNGNHAWESWELANQRMDWNYSYPFHSSFVSAAASARQVALHDHGGRDGSSSAAINYNPDPHLMCLKLGKRHYFEDVVAAAPMMGQRHVGCSSMSKKGKPYGREPAAAVVPRCQVEECEAVLVNAKDYHRRHKVCEMHAKAPRVVVLGIEQRFCQQCSRFHAVAEFDEAKRSCRRRLAGHNERRRKSSQEHNSLARKPSQDIKMTTAGRHPYFLNTSECALSLLSSSNYNPWNLSPTTSSPDLPARCSAALRELIAENRASILACRQLIYTSSNQIEDYNAYNKLGSVRAGSNPQEHVTLDLMQAPNSAFGLLSVNDHYKSGKEGDEEEEDCSELWKVPLGY